MTLEAGVDIPIQALWIRGNTVRFRRQNSKEIEQFRLVHDAMFMHVPEVDYHADAEEVTCMKECIMVIEGFIPNVPSQVETVRVDRVSFVVRK
jgi:hypothetical protein